MGPAPPAAAAVGTLLTLATCRQQAAHGAGRAVQAADLQWLNRFRLLPVLLLTAARVQQLL